MTELKDKLTEATNVLKLVEKYKPKVDGASIDVIVSFEGDSAIRIFEGAGDYEMELY